MRCQQVNCTPTSAGIFSITRAPDEVQSTGGSENFATHYTCTRGARNVIVTKRDAFPRAYVIGYTANRERPLAAGYTHTMGDRRDDVRDTTGILLLLLLQRQRCAFTLHRVVLCILNSIGIETLVTRYLQVDYDYIIMYFTLEEPHHDVA